MQPQLFPLLRNPRRKDCYAISVNGRHVGTYTSTTKAGAIAQFRRLLAKQPDTWVRPEHQVCAVLLPRVVL